MTPKSDEELCRHRAPELLLAYPAEFTETGVLLLYAWPERHYAHLLPERPGDSYQRPKVELSDLFK